MIKEKIFSLHKLLEEYVGEREVFNYPIVANNNSFYVVHERNPKYVQPFFKELFSNCEKEEHPQVLCVAATGASGKSVLAEYISAEKQCPIFNLGEHPAVADSALVGVLYNSLGHENMTPFLGGLHEGRSLVIIDGADEGMVKVGNFDAFKNFLKGIADIAKKNPRTSFIILGRISAMEIVQLVLDEYEVKTRCVKIEAFTEEQAKEFINKSTGKSDSDTVYKELRDYILGTVGDIFKDQHDIKTSDYQKFIGYAPVLMAISKLILDEKNPHRLYQELCRQNVKSIDLLIAICESILQRDKGEKINPVLLKGLVEKRNETFSQQVYENVYTNTEQCYRVLAKVMGQNVNLSVTGDREFDVKYEEQIKTWIEDHPFYDLDKRRIQNAVFESYIIATLIPIAEYRGLVYQYLHSIYKDVFVLFYIYDALRQNDKTVEESFLPYLLSSAHSLDDSEHRVEVQIEEDDDEQKQSNQPTLCRISVNSYNKKYDFEIEVPEGQSLFIGDEISNTSVVTPSLSFELNRLQSTLVAPVSIHCKTLYSKAGDIRVEYAPTSGSSGVVVDCENVVADFSNSQQYRFYVANGKDIFVLFTEDNPGYPFDSFWNDEARQTGLNEAQLKVYQKLRRTISLFKSHSKGRLAKYKDKIDNRRWLGSTEWQFLLKALLEKGVFYVEENFYFISPEQLGEKLGVSYDQLRSGVMTDKIVTFIKEIKP